MTSRGWLSGLLMIASGLSFLAIPGLEGCSQSDPSPGAPPTRNTGGTYNQGFCERVLAWNSTFAVTAYRSTDGQSASALVTLASDYRPIVPVPTGTVSLPPAGLVIVGGHLTRLLHTSANSYPSVSLTVAVDPGQELRITFPIDCNGLAFSRTLLLHTGGPATLASTAGEAGLSIDSLSWEWVANPG